MNSFKFSTTRQNPFSADRFHIHHMLKSRFNLSSPATVYVLLGVNIMFGGCGVLLAVLPEILGWAIIGFLFCAIVAFLIVLGYSRLVFPPKLERQRAVSYQVKTNGHYAAKNGNGGLPSATKLGTREQK